jgi:hypothetical protein
MPTKIVSTPRDGYVLIESSGTIASLEEHKAHTDEIARLVFETEYMSILLDERNIVYQVNLTSLYEIVNYYEESLQDAARNKKMASISKKEYIQGARFWETVARNRGFNFKVFVSLAEAEQWLRSG